MPESWIVPFLTDLTTWGGGGGVEGSKIEAMIGVVSGTGNRGEDDPDIQRIQYPVHLWHEAADGRNLLGWRNPETGPVLPSGRPWGLPLAAFSEERMRERLLLTITVVDDDKPEAESALQFGTGILPGVARAAAAYLGSPDAGETAGGIAEEIVGLLQESWKPDVIGVHTNVLSRDENWGVGQDVGPIEESGTDGRIRLSYSMRRIEVDHPIPVRVRLTRIEVPSDLDDDTWPVTNRSDIYIRSRVWGGAFAGQVPSPTRELRTPERRHYYLNSGEDKVLDKVLFEGEIGPFPFVDVGVWDYDDISADDMHGVVWGLWLTPQLIQSFEANHWTPLRFQSVSRGRHLRLDFQIEPINRSIVWLYSWWSESRGDHFTTSDPDWESTGTTDRSRSPDYRYRRMEGALVNPALPRPEGAVPLHSWYSRDWGDHKTTSDPEFIGGPGQIRQPGNYMWLRDEGWLFDPQRPQPDGTVPLHGWWNATLRDSRATSEWDGQIGASRDSYQYRRLEGYITTLL